MVCSKSLWAAFSILAAFSAEGFAASCSTLSIRGFSEGDVVRFNKSKSKWEEVTNFARLASGSRRSFEFFYVVKGGPQQPGVVVVKSARKPRPSAEERALTVRMQRQRFDRDCVDGVSPPIDARVADATYDGYHDYGDAGEGVELIRRFHINYVNRKGKCTRTDKAHGKNLFDRRGNRSQFSFDTTVVHDGMYLKGWSRLTGRAVAGNQLYDRNVQMKPYVIAADGTACVPFNLRLHDNSIVRIVDIEARSNSGERLRERER